MASERGADVWGIIKDRITNNNARFQQAESTVRLLGKLETDEALKYLRLALRQEALASLTVYVLGEMKTEAARDIYQEALEENLLAGPIIEQLSLLRTTRAIRLLGSALERSELSAQAARALERVSKNRTHPSAAQAFSILETWKRRQEQSQDASSPSVVGLDSALARPRGGLEDHDWTSLMYALNYGRFTVFIGDDTSSGYLPTRAEIARELAADFNYPLEDPDNLSSVARYVSIQAGYHYVRLHLRHIYENAAALDFTKDNPYTALASLPLPLYITTTYDDLLVQALRSQGRAPRKEIYNWYEADSLGYKQEAFARPTIEEPVVFHLYGQADVPDSMAIATDDLFHLLINTAHYDLLPPPIRAALAGPMTVLLLGYRLSDLNFQVLFSLLRQYTGRDTYRRHLSVQLPPLPDSSPDEQIVKACEFTARYLANAYMKVYWGTVKEFTAELKERWKGFDSRRA